MAGDLWSAFDRLGHRLCISTWGLPTFLAGCLATAAVLIITRKSPAETLKGISWSVLSLVAGLFVVVGALNQTGLIGRLAHYFPHYASSSLIWIAAGAGMVVALVSNLINNLPAGLIAGSAVQLARLRQDRWRRADRY